MNRVSVCGPKPTDPQRRLQVQVEIIPYAKPSQNVQDR